jgi:hypothetical protein
MFDYQKASLEEMIEHVKTASSASVTRMKRFYEKKGSKDVVQKIDMARECVKLEKVQQRMEALKNV